jgi:pimeloyl-ACP methyl ester carboxylesterase
MNYVLIPGPWMGGWIWEPVARRLEELGHQAYPVTLTGLDRPDTDVSGITLETHVHDVLSLLVGKDLSDVVLVGHSTTGVIAGIVADRVPQRVVRTVLIESFLPTDGQSALGHFPEPLRMDEERVILESGGRWPVPDVTVVAEGQDLSFEQARSLVERCVGHPGRPLLDPVTLQRPVAEQPVTYIICAKDHYAGQISAEVEAMRAEPSWAFRSLDTGHWPMVTASDALAGLLDEAAHTR